MTAIREVDGGLASDISKICHSVMKRLWPSCAANIYVGLLTVPKGHMVLITVSASKITWKKIPDPFPTARFKNLYLKQLY